MPRSFDLSAESPASVDQVHAAFGDEEYWLARLEVFGAGPGAATLDSLTVDSAGTVVVATPVLLNCAKSVQIEGDFRWSRCIVEQTH